MPETRVLLVDDEPGVRFGIAQYFAGRGTRVTEAESCAEAQARFRASRFDAAILDYRLPDGDALTLLGDLQKIDPQVPIIILTGHASIDLAVNAMKQGAEHFLTKPVEMAALDLVLERSVASRRDRRKVAAQESSRGRRILDPFAGESEALRLLAERAAKAAASDRPILILGETGAGKGVLASWLQATGPRRDEPFVDLNCAGLKTDLLESELFGHHKGAFTGAIAAKVGLLEAADRGTLFLDEIGDMELQVQPKLLKVLEEMRFRRLGEVADRQVDIRLIAATSHDLGALTRDKQFREDLYYRISTLPLTVPPLRERSVDIPVLARSMLADLGRELGRPQLEVSEPALAELTRRPWPGNIRELRNVLERAALLTGGDLLEVGDLHFDSLLGASPATGTTDGDATLLELEKNHIRMVLERREGNVGRAAKILGIPRSTLYQKIKKYGIETPKGRP